MARERLTPDDLIPEQRIDLEVACDESLWKLEGAVRHFEPFGMGNPAPRSSRAASRSSDRRALSAAMGSSLPCAASRVRLEAIGWGMADLAATLVPGATVDVAYRLERDEYHGEERLVAKLCAVRA